MYVAKYMQLIPHKVHTNNKHIHAGKVSTGPKNKANERRLIFTCNGQPILVKNLGESDVLTES